MRGLAQKVKVVAYFPSLVKTKVAYPLLAVMLLQVGLIGLFHSSIAQIVNVMLICGATSLLILVPFYRGIR